MTATRTRSDAHEKRCSEAYGAKVNPNSGATANHELKGDLRHPLLTFECKCTTKDSITITKGISQKIREEASLLSKQPVIELEFQDENPDKFSEAWAAFDRGFASELLSVFEKSKSPELSAKEFLSIISNYLSKDQKEDLRRSLRQLKELKRYNLTHYELSECL